MTWLETTKALYEATNAGWSRKDIDALDDHLFNSLPAILRLVEAARFEVSLHRHHEDEDGPIKDLRAALAALDEVKP